MALISRLFSRTIHPMRITRFSSSITKDLISKTREDLIGPGNQDVLLSNLKQAQTTENVLNLVSSHRAIMNNKHLMQALRSIFLLQKGGDSQLSMSQIMSHPDFEVLCRNLKKRAGTIELNDTIEALKVFNYIGVPSDSAVTTSLLNLLRHQINNMSLAHTVFSDFLLSQMKRTPLIEALQIALPIVFEINLPIKLDPDNVTQLIEYLHYVSSRSVSESCTELIINALMRYQGEVGCKQSISVIWSICDLKPDVYYEPLLKKFIKSLIVHVDTLKYQDLENTLAKLSLAYSVKNTYFYDEVFCDICANFVIDNDEGVKHAIYLFRRFSKMNHESTNLLDYVSKKIHDDPSIFYDLDALVLQTLITALAMTDYRPKYWETLRSLLMESTTFERSTKKELHWIKVAISLCMLDICKPEITQIALRPGYIHKMLQRGYVTDYGEFLLLHQAIMTQKTKYEGPLPSESLLGTVAFKFRHQNEFPLEAALQKAFGGENYVATKLTTNLHHLIDHVIMLRKGGFPIAFPTNSKVQRLEDLHDELKNDNKIVIIMGLNQLHYTSNTKRLRSQDTLAISTLESQGYIVVPISLETWTDLADFEKIPYLVQAVNTKALEGEQLTSYAC